MESQSADSSLSSVFSLGALMAMPIILNRNCLYDLHPHRNEWRKIPKKIVGFYDKNQIENVWTARFIYFSKYIFYWIATSGTKPS